MATNFKLLFAVAGSILLLFSCNPAIEKLCNDGNGGEADVNDLFKIEPLQNTYVQGDVVVLSFSLPNTNDYFGRNVNLFGQTFDAAATVYLGNFGYLSEGNLVTPLTGSNGAAANLFEAPINANLDAYELRLSIKLNRAGTYSFNTNRTEQVELEGRSDCDNFVLYSNFQGRDENNQISFTVE